MDVNKAASQKTNIGPNTNSKRRSSIMNRIVAIAATVVGIGILAGTASAGIVQHVLVMDIQHDTGFSAGRILEFDLDGNFIGVFDSGYRSAGMQQADDYTIYVSDTDDVSGAGGGPIRSYDVDGTPLTHAYNGGTDIRPDDLAFDSNGDLFFDNAFGGGNEDDQIYRVDGTNTASVVVPKTFNDPSGLTGTDTLNTPRGLAIDADDDIVVADRGNQRLLEFNSSGNLIAVLATGKQNIQAPFIADNGNIFYTYVDNDEEEYYVEEISSGGGVLNTYTYDYSASGTNPTLFDSMMLPNGDLLVSGFSADEVFRLDPDTGTFSTFASGSFDGTVMDGPNFMTVMTIIPEPTTLVLLGLGVVTLLGRRRRRVPRSRTC